MTDADFQKDNYEKTQLISNELTSASDPLYRLSTSENWRIVIQVDRTTAAQLENEQYVKVRFLKTSMNPGDRFPSSTTAAREMSWQCWN